MAQKAPRLALTREQVLGFRQKTGLLTERLPAAADALRRAAWAGLQDSMPRAALLSIHARVQGADANICAHGSLVQLWGPRYSDYVVAAKDLAIFSLGRLPDDDRRRKRAYDTAARLYALLKGERMPFGQAGRAMGVQPNSLRYAAPTGTVLLRWDGVHQPIIWSSPPPTMEAGEARLELARRHLHIFGPTTAAAFARWAGISTRQAGAAFERLAPALIATRTPAGDGWILAQDEAEAQRGRVNASATVRLLPSGDAYCLLWGADRELLVPEARQRAQLWTTRVWPGAVLIGGEIAGVWRRSAASVSMQMWRALSSPEWEAVEREAAALPLPGLKGPISVQRG